MLSQLSYTAQDTLIKGGTARVGWVLSCQPSIQLVRHRHGHGSIWSGKCLNWVSFFHGDSRFVSNEILTGTSTYYMLISIQSGPEWAFSSLRCPDSYLVVFHCIFLSCSQIPMADSLGSFLKLPRRQRKSGFSFSLPPCLSLAKLWTGFPWVKCLFRLMERIQVPRC